MQQQTILTVSILNWLPTSVGITLPIRGQISVLCLERQGAESKEIRVHHEKCILAPEGQSRIFRLDELEVKTGN